MAKCPVCGEPTRPRAKYCCGAHKQAAYRERNAARNVTALRLEDFGRVMAALEEIKARLDSLPTHHQEELPTRASQPHSPLPTGDLIEFSRPTVKAGKAGQIMLLQVWLASKTENISLFTDADLELVTGHPAFPQRLIEAEKARRAGAASSAINQEASPAIRTIKGAESVNLTPPNFDDLDLL